MIVIIESNQEKYCFQCSTQEYVMNICYYTQCKAKHYLVQRSHSVWCWKVRSQNIWNYNIFYWLLGHGRSAYNNLGPTINGWGMYYKGHFFVWFSITVSMKWCRINCYDLLLTWKVCSWFHSFWKNLGTYMSKIDPDQAKIHFIGNNVTGNKKGEKLMKFLSKAMRPSKVKVESPLELGQAGGWWKVCHFQQIMHIQMHLIRFTN